MSKSDLSRRNVMKAGAAGLAVPTIFTGAAWAASHTGFTNAPQGDTVTLGFNVPQTGPYADEGADELRAYELAVEHLNGGGDGGMMNTFSSKTLDGTGIMGKAGGKILQLVEDLEVTALADLSEKNLNEAADADDNDD